MKKYTLYYKGNNKYNHEHNLPIISLDLKTMDEYTSNYSDFNDLFNCLPKEVTDFINNELSHNIDKKSNNFFIQDDSNNLVLDVIFNDNLEVLYITKEEVDDMIVKSKMSVKEFEIARYGLDKTGIINKKYEFFKYLYNTYVKDKDIVCMIDCYDVEKSLPNLSVFDTILAALATDKDNIKVLCKKLCQKDENRRNLAFEFQKLFKNINKNNKMIENEKILSRKNKHLNKEKMNDEILNNLIEFKKHYLKEYNS